MFFLMLLQDQINCHKILMMFQNLIQQVLTMEKIMKKISNSHFQKNQRVLTLQKIQRIICNVLTTQQRYKLMIVRYPCTEKLMIICVFHFLQHHATTLGEQEIQNAVEAAAVIFKKVVLQRRQEKKAAEEGMYNL